MASQETIAVKTEIKVDLSRIARDLKLSIEGVQRTVELLDDDNTVPFITRYRKDLTGGLDEQQIRTVKSRVAEMRQLVERKQTILKAIEAQDKLTPELADRIRNAMSPKRLEDIYLPFKPKKQTLATAAREKGLEPLAEAILNPSEAGAEGDADQLATRFCAENDPASTAEALQGAGHILAEWMSERADLRSALRDLMRRNGKLVAVRAVSLDEKKVEPPAENQPSAKATPSEAPTEGSTAVETKEVDATQSSAIDSAPADTPNEDPNTAPASESEASKGAPAEQPSGDQPSGEQSDSGEQSQPPGEQTPVEEAPVEEAPGEQAPGENAAGEQAPVENAAVEEAAVEEAAVEEAPVEEAPVEEAPVEEAPVENAAGEQAPADQVSVTQASIEQPPAEAPASAEQTADSEASATPVTPPASDDGAASDRAGEAGQTAADAQPPASAPKPAPALAKAVSKSISKTATRKAKKRQQLENAFKDYFDYHEPLSKAPAHRILAVNRGERAKVLRVRIETDMARLLMAAEKLVIPEGHACSEFLLACLKDAIVRLILPSLEREARRELTERAEQHAVEVFVRNLRKLFLQPPVRGRRVLAIDPGFRSGCKVAGVDEFGAVLFSDTVFIVGKPDRIQKSRQRLVGLVRRHDLNLIAIGNGTACRETEQLVSDMLAEELKDSDVQFVIVNEAGASVYSTSQAGREELPNHEAIQRSAISIGRRLLDPLSELVKINPANIGVGLYQHDVRAKHLRESLDAVVESCVNYVGVDVNTASPALLRYVSGLNQLTARRLYEHRLQSGPFKNREQLKEVPGFGDATFVQSAGFLKIIDGDNPLDATWIHPESYEIAVQVLDRLGASTDDLGRLIAAKRPKQPSPTPTTETPASETPTTETPATETPASEAPATETPATETPVTEAPATETPATETPATETPATETPATETPATETPATETPATETPATETPATETPATETPATETPATETPATETPASETPASETPASETPATKTPASEAQVNGREAPAATAEATDRDSTIETSVESPSPTIAPPTAETQASAEAVGADLLERAKQLDLKQVADQLQVGELLLRDMVSSLSRPMRDPREDFPPPMFRRGVMKLEDLKAGVELTAVVLNVVDFGAFVDIGLSDSGLIHISRLADRYIRDPHEVVSVGDRLPVWVVDVDMERRRVSLTAIRPGSERKNDERPQRGQRGKKKPEGGGGPSKPRGSGGRPPHARSGKPDGRPGRKPGGKGKGRPSTAYKPKPKPAPIKPITKEMEEGTEPLRSFSDLMQFYEKKEENDSKPPESDTPSDS